MRLKAENALASNDDARKRTALEAILQQVARLDSLLRDLLEMTQTGQPKFSDVELSCFLGRRPMAGMTVLDIYREYISCRRVEAS